RRERRCAPPTAASRCRRRARRGWSARPPSGRGYSCTVRNSRSCRLSSGAARAGAPRALWLFLRRRLFACRGRRGFEQAQQLLRRNPPLRGLGQFEDEIDDLLLEDRRAQIAQRLGVAAVVVDHLALVAGMTLRLADQRLVDLLLAHRDVVVAADLRQEQAEADAALGEPAELGLVLVAGFRGRGGGRLPRLRLAAGRGLGRPGRLGPVLLQDRIVLDLDHSRRYGEFVSLGQFVKQVALQPLAGEAVIVAAHPLLDLVAQLLGGFEPDLLGQLVALGRRLALAHLLDRDLELGLLAGQLGVEVVGREGHRHGAALARGDAGELLGEAGQHAFGAELDLAALGAGSRDLVVADAADDVGDDDVAERRRPVDGRGFALLLGDPRHRAVDVLGGNVGDQPLQPEPGEIRLRLLRQQLDRHRVFEVGALGGRDDL